ncbi:MAG: 2-hydroxyacyl-CoA dehydratase family protein [Dictyoglomus sp.]|nr:2-hydroxyacyl-CoA dehydratase family protein [Dictyoglomus sp.]MCX7942853.1 2-hydroxyacyl-CoA dehydratase family protein [Dictyoglomaceae bacterium]MDW8189081.1 2-hydroxyacyl-CoA dehydratase family protein [Dictyoglomus sp.]
MKLNLDKRNIEKIRRILRFPLVYPLGDIFIKLKFRKNKVTLVSYEYALDLVKHNYMGKNKVVITNILMPSELFFALDLFPLFPEVASAFSASLGFADKTLFDSEEIVYSKDLCSVHRNVIGLTKNGILPKPDFIISTSHPCHSAIHSFFLISQLFGGEYFPIDVPLRDNNSIDYTAKKFEELFFILVKKLKIKKPMLGLERAIKYSNISRDYLMEINELRKDYLVIDGRNFLDYAGMIFSTFGSHWGVKFFKVLRDEIKDRIKKKKFLPYKKRVCWLHLGPYFKTDFFDWLKSKSCTIVFEESSKVYWDKLDPKDPFKSLAKKVINAKIFYDVDERFNIALEGVKDYKAQGVIIFNQWGCRQGAGNSYILRRRLMEVGIPAIVIDGDLIDKGNFPLEQVKTRIEAFLEVL